MADNRTPGGVQSPGAQRGDDTASSGEAIGSPPILRGLSSSEREWRRSGLGGSDAGAILGLSRWASALDVYAEKVGEPDDDEPTEAMEWGIRMEPVLRRRYNELTGRRAVKPPRRRHAARRWQIGHPDGLDKEVVVELKTDRWGHGWGPSGSQEVPPDYKAQLWHYMDLTGRRIGELYVLIGGSEERLYRFDWEPGIELMREELAEWWDRHIVGGIEPELDAGAGRWLRRRYPAEDGSMLVALPHQYGLLREMLNARRRAKAWEVQAQRLAQQVQGAMGTASELHAPGVKITWKREAARVGWREYADSLERLVAALPDVAWGDERMTGAELAGVLKGLYTAEPQRTFRVNTARSGPTLLDTQEETPR